MGEKSREVGEDGEKLVRSLLTLIGWSPVESNLSILCSRPSEHGLTQGKIRHTHGVDFLFSYKSPLNDFTQQIVCVSSKATSKNYKSAPSTEFKSYLVDITNACECFRRSEIYLTTTENADHSIKEFRLDSVIFFISLLAEDRASIKEKISTIAIPKDLNFNSVSLIDNNAASFIFDTVCYARRSGDSFLFDYSLSAQNLKDSDIAYSGSVLPYEYLSSPIIYMRITVGDKSIFCISCNEGFSKEGFARILNLAADLTKALNSDFLFLFREYREGLHQADVNAVVTALKVRVPNLNVRIDQLGSDFRSLISE